MSELARRSFLGVSALGVTSLAAGCAGAPIRPELDASEAHVLVGRLERGLAALRDVPVGTMAARFPRHARPDLSEEVLRLTLESLVVADVLRSIPEGATVPHALGEALAPLLPRFNRCVHTQRALLSRMPTSHRQGLDRALRTNPSLPMDVAEWIDGQASELDVPADNRARLRHAAVSAGTRMRRQSVHAVIEDCVAKVDLAFERQGATLPADLRARTGALVDAMWQQVEDGSSAAELASPLPPPPAATTTPGIITAVAAAAVPPVGDPRDDGGLTPDRFGTSAEMADPTEPVQWNASWARPGDEERRLGTIMMPLGLVSCGLLLIIGLIVFIAGEVQDGQWDGRSHGE